MPARPAPALPVGQPAGRAWTSVWPGLGVLVVIATAATALASVVPFLSPLVTAIVLGALVVNVTVVPARFGQGIAFGSRSLLRLGVVLLGFRLSVGDLGGLGLPGLGVVALVVTVTFVGTRRLARWLGLPEDLGLLVATGYSICGASAIVAMDGVVHADEEETAYAITLVTLCGTLSIFVLPLLAGALGLSGEAFGSWVGGSVHDVGQVVATAAHADAAAVSAATVVKLTRVVLLAPLVAIVAIRRRRLTASSATVADHPPLLPLFVCGFLAAIAVRSSGLLGAGALGDIATVEKLVLTIALVGLGMGVRVQRMGRLGGRPLLLGMSSWVLVASAAYVGTIAVT